MIKNSARIFILTVLAVASLRTNFIQTRPQAQCVEITTNNSPEKMPEAQISETWCYEDQITNGKKLTFIYKPEESSINPALSALVERDLNNKIVSITHASLNRGVISYHKMDGFLNPLPVPLTAGESTLKTNFINQPAVDSLQVDESFKKLANYKGPLVTNKININSFAITTKEIKPGVFESHLPEASRPYDGYWWEDNGTLFAGEQSPLGKYDAMVKSWTGQDPGSRNWEAQNHSDVSVPWGGHCNGWAASSVLFEEPKDFYWDKANKTVIFPSDIKGLLAENSFCVNWAFYGNRYWGNPGDDLSDISPDLFHKVITYYIGTLQKPVALDYFRDAWVDNHVLSGYKLTIDKVPNNTKQFLVTAVLDENWYNGNRQETPDKAKVTERHYQYTLDVDASGNITGGKWIGDNPDFLWVPLSPANGNCGWRNPNLKLQNILSIPNQLSKATIKTVNINYDINQSLPSGMKINIPIPAAVSNGSFYKIYYSKNNFATEVAIVTSGSYVYPQTNNYHSTTWNNWTTKSSSGVVTVNMSNITKIEISNPDNSSGSHFQIDKIEFYSGD